MISIVVLSKYRDLFTKLVRSLENQVGDFRRIVVVDGTWDPPYGWERVQGLQPFSMAGNHNLGWNAAGRDDVMDVCDDVRFTSETAILKLSALAEKHKEAALVAPKIVGGTGNHLQIYGMPPRESFFYTEERIPFICEFFRREVLDQVGPIDERFAEYGYDDVDWCLRAKQAGYKLAITNDVVVEHECTATFRRNQDPLGAHLSRTKALFAEKWGHTNLY